MLNNKTIAVVVPAYNESSQISMVLDSMPDFVDRIVVVDDKSKDNTVEVVKAYLSQNKSSLEIQSFTSTEIEETPYNKAEIALRNKALNEVNFFTSSNCHNLSPSSERIILIEHNNNAGVGAAIASGYKWCKDHAIDCTAVMAGDGQMDPSELKSICLPVIEESVDYVKGNRLIHQSAWVIIPKIRFFGNSILSILTKIASGYWHISDTQTGYTAISNHALNALSLIHI